MFLKPIVRFFALAPLFLIPFFPLIVADSYFFPFITGKAFYFRILVEVAFAAWVVLAFLDAKYRPKCNPLTIAVTVFALVALVADLAGVNPIRSLWSNFERMEGWITIIHLWMLYMVAVYGFVGENSKKLWHSWINVSVFAAFCVACYGFGQFFGWAAIHQSSSRIDASLGNSAYMAVYMLLSAGFAVYLLLESRVRRAVAGFTLSGLEWLYLVLSVAFSFLLIETATRGTIIGLVAGTIIALLAYAVFGRTASKLARQVSGGIVGAIVVLGILFIVFRNAPIIQKIEPLQRLASISLSNTESVSRLYIWHMAFTGFEQRPILGWGQENFNYVFNANYNPKMYNQEQWFDRAHDVYIDWLMNGGIVGLLAYLALYVFFLWTVWKSTLSIAEKSALTGLLAGYAVHNIFVFDNLASYVLFFALLGLAASLTRASTASDSIAAPSTAAKTAPREINPEIIEYIIAPVAIIALVFGIYWFNVRPIQEDTRLIAALEACDNGNPAQLPDASLFTNALSVGAYIGDQEIREQILSCAGNVLGSQQIPNQTKQAFFELATQAVTDQVAATPKDARIYTLAGSFYEQIGAFDQALPLLEKAHLLSPAKQSTDFALGTAYINLGQYDKAVALLKTAYESETDNADAAAEYATALIVDGHDDQAHALFGSDPSIFNTEQAAQAYTVAKQYSKAIAIYIALIGTSTDQVQTQLHLAQTQYAAGMTSAAIATLKTIEQNHPEYTSELDAAIKQVQSKD
jgi:O-antigen ligase/tetratricopeptide (TPR) repeat protein